MNIINVIHPYTSQCQLVFDDPSTSLVREALIAGTDKILQTLAASKGVNPDDFTLIFSASPFPDYQAMAKWVRTGVADCGAWYSVSISGLMTDHMGWLCPALLKYFDTAPEFIYFQIKTRGTR